MQALEKALNSFSEQERMIALERLARSLESSDRLNNREEPEHEIFNMHIHSFFSHNAKGYSPAGIAWESRKAGHYAVALCDFDVLDGMNEFLKAGFMLGIRTAVHLETRVFFGEYAGLEINSPGEPGIAYIMGSGFVKQPDHGTPEAAMLMDLRRRANERNRKLVGRINSRLPDISADYEREIVPMSPGGCPTERHIVRMYRLKAESVFGISSRLFEFWAELMETNRETIENMYPNIPGIEERIRAVLVKSGGIGYETPSGDSFPPIPDFIQWTLACNAIPTITWLDGTSEGEANTTKLFNRMKNMGACALNIIPDRNHNISDPEVRSLKLRNLEEAVKTARELEMPVNIGTEMNKDGQPFADDTNCAALRSYHKDFLRGARIMTGQTWLSLFADFSYTGEAATAEFGSNTRKKNQFFESVGSLPPLTAAAGKRLEDAGAQKARDIISRSARHGAWTELDMTP